MHQLRPYLQLMRLPAVFTAMANIALGFLLTHPSLQHEGSLLPFVLLVLASSCLYLAGMVFNDVFDRRIDAEQRPNRPIPSGRIPLRIAILLGGGLIVTGLTAAACVGANAALMGAMLSVAIFAYDGGLKKTPLGPLAMGSCRFLNILLGSSAVSDFGRIWTAPQVNVAAALAVYIAGVTWFARQEAANSDRRQLAAAAVVLNLGLCGLLFLGINTDYGVGGHAATMRVTFAWFLIVMVIDRPVTQALLDPSPKMVQRAVKTMIQWLILLDATMIYAATGSAAFAVGTALLLLPTLLVGRWVYVT